MDLKRYMDINFLTKGYTHTHVDRSKFTYEVTTYMYFSKVNISGLQCRNLEYLKCEENPNAHSKRWAAAISLKFCMAMTTYSHFSEKSTHHVHVNNLICRIIRE